MTTAVDDEVRVDVERWLHALVGAIFAAPAAVLAGVGRCLGSRVGPVTDRLAEPVRVVRSLVELVTGAAAPSGTTAPVEPATPVATTPPEPGPAAPSAEELPIDEYQSLAASHVVARLPSLTPAELRRVRRFELAHRGRRTVVGKIDQLLASS